MGIKCQNGINSAFYSFWYPTRIIDIFILMVRKSDIYNIKLVFWYANTFCGTSIEFIQMNSFFTKTRKSKSPQIYLIYT